MRAVHGIRDIATWELSRHGLLSCEWDGLILFGEEKADFNTVVPRLVCIIVGEDTGRLGLESSDSFLDKSLVCHISVEDLSSVGRGNKFALQHYLNSQLILVSLQNRNSILGGTHGGVWRHPPEILAAEGIEETGLSWRGESGHIDQHDNPIRAKPGGRSVFIAKSFDSRRCDHAAVAVTDHDDVLASIRECCQLGRKGSGVLCHANGGIGIANGRQRNGLCGVPKRLELGADCVKSPGSVPRAGGEDNGWQNITLWRGRGKADRGHDGEGEVGEMHVG